MSIGDAQPMIVSRVSGCISILFLIVVTVGSGLAIGVTNPPIGWFDGLLQGRFFPLWVFKATWIISDVMMAIAGWRIYRSPSKSIGLCLWTLLIGFNFSAHRLFFTIHRIWVGLVLTELMLTVASIGIGVGIIAAVWRRDRLAVVLLLPNFGWGLFAAGFNSAAAALELIRRMTSGL